MLCYQYDDQENLAPLETIHPIYFGVYLDPLGWHCIESPDYLENTARYWIILPVFQPQTTWLVIQCERYIQKLVQAMQEKLVPLVLNQIELVYLVSPKFLTFYHFFAYFPRRSKVLHWKLVENKMYLWYCLSILLISSIKELLAFSQKKLLELFLLLLTSNSVNEKTCQINIVQKLK